MYRSTQELENGLEEIRRSPKEEGILKLIVRRPQTEQREILDSAELTDTDGVVGDNWKTRGSSKTADGSAFVEVQITMINARAIDLIAAQKERWALAGDQLFVDFDLSHENLPAGTRLSVGSAIVEITEPPHLGCKKFSARFGREAMAFVNSDEGKSLRLRGLHARVVEPGSIKVGDRLRKLRVSTPA